MASSSARFSFFFAFAATPPAASAVPNVCNGVSPAFGCFNKDAPIANALSAHAGVFSSGLTPKNLFTSAFASSGEVFLSISF